MAIQAGLVGLPNVGKSTLFNALTKSQIPAENYPFCTIDPHIAITHVPDPRLEKLKQIYNSEKIIPATVTFVDIAGLVKGASKGEGLGNQFLGHIKEVDLILHVIRCFEDPNVIKTGISPLDDYQIITQELMLKDLESIEKRIEKLPTMIKRASSAAEKKEFEQELVLLQQLQHLLNQGNEEQIRKLVSESEVKTIPLLASKNFLIIANISEQELDSYESNKGYQELVAHFGQERVIPICAKVEYELSQMDDSSAQEFMDLLGLKEPGLDVIIRKTYQHLGMITFFTCGPREIHAWPIKKGITIRQAAGEIHSDLEKGFISADVFNYKDLVTYGSEAKIKEAGKMQKVGQDYIMQDGDTIFVRFNV